MADYVGETHVQTAAVAMRVVLAVRLLVAFGYIVVHSVPVKPSTSIVTAVLTTLIVIITARHVSNASTTRKDRMHGAMDTLTMLVQSGPPTDCALEGSHDLYSPFAAGKTNYFQRLPDGNCFPRGA